MYIQLIIFLGGDICVLILMLGFALSVSASQVHHWIHYRHVGTQLHLQAWRLQDTQTEKKLEGGRERESKRDGVAYKRNLFFNAKKPNKNSVPDLSLERCV